MISLRCARKTCDFSGCNGTNSKAHGPKAHGRQGLALARSAAAATSALRAATATTSPAAATASLPLAWALALAREAVGTDVTKRGLHRIGLSAAPRAATAHRAAVIAAATSLATWRAGGQRIRNRAVRMLVVMARRRGMGAPCSTASTRPPGLEAK